MNDLKYRQVFRDLPTLKTPRLTLKKICISDAEDMYSYASLNSVTKYLLWSPHLNIEDTRGYIEFINRQYKKGTYADWGINLPGVFIGTIGFVAFNYEENSGEIGYVLNPSYQGNGYMTEALSAILNLSFNTLCLDKAVLRIMEENIPSRSLALRLGFEYIGNEENLLIAKGISHIVCRYELKKDKFLNNFNQLAIKCRSLALI